MISEITKRLARRIWQTFEDKGMPNTSEGNYLAAKGTIRRILNGTYTIDEWRTFFNAEDANYLKARRDEIIKEETVG